MSKHRLIQYGWYAILLTGVALSIFSCGSYDWNLLGPSNSSKRDYWLDAYFQFQTEDGSATLTEFCVFLDNEKSGNLLYIFSPTTHREIGSHSIFNPTTNKIEGEVERISGVELGSHTLNFRIVKQTQSQTVYNVIGIRIELWDCTDNIFTCDFVKDFQLPNTRASLKEGEAVSIKFNI